VEYAGMKLLLNAGWDESLPLASLDNNIDNNDGNANHTQPAPKQLPDVDAILITDSTLSSLGGLPLYFGASKEHKRGRMPRSRSSSNTHDDGNMKANPPFLATYPTVKMGQMTLYDHHASLSLDGSNPGYSLEDVDAVFSKDSFVTLKYSQTLYLPLDENEGSSSTDKSKKTTKNKLLSITPHLSGHVVGGCYYVLKRLTDDTQVILAPTYHHAKEKHLAGCTLHKFGVNADALLTMPGGARGLLGKLYQPPPPRNSGSVIHYNKGKPILSPPMGNRSEAELIESIMATLRRDGNVLLPVDASGRVLELLLVLDRHWERQRLSGAYNLCWVGPMAYNTIEFARSQLEWMAEPLGAQFDSQRGHPYALKSVRICASVSELEGVIESSNGNPTVVLASGTSLDHGPARDLLLKWGENPDNLILITDSTRCVPRGDVWFGGEKADRAVKEERRTLQEDKETDEDGKLAGTAIAPSDVSAYTTASQLLYQWCLAKAGGEEMADEVAIDVHVPHRTALAGAELKAFLADEETERVRIQAEAEKKAMMQEIEQAKGQLRLGEDDAGTKASGAAASSSKGTGASVGRPKKKSRFDQNLFIKFSKPVHSELLCFNMCFAAILLTLISDELFVFICIQ
jgi:cleavage and polyadenylation specificity factor subunit 2